MAKLSYPNMSVRDNKPQVIKYFFYTFFILCALYIKIEIIPHDGSELPLLAFLAKFRESFYDPNGIELILGGAIFSLFYFIDKIEQSSVRNNWPLVILSGFFAIIFVYCRSIEDLGSGRFIYDNNYQLFLAALCICGYWQLFFLGLRWAGFFLASCEVENTPATDYKRLWLFGFIIILLCWLPWIFASYPATFCPDSRYQMNQFFGISPWTSHHPPLSTVIMGLWVSLGATIKSRTFGVFLYIIFQTLAGAAVFSFLLISLRKMCCSNKVYFAGLAFYALSPLMPTYAQWFEKDFLYVIFYSLTLTLLLMVFYTRHCSTAMAVCITVVLTISCLLRNNGKFELFPLLIIFCFMCKKNIKKKIIVSCASSLLLFFLINNMLYPALGIAKGSVAEMLSVPFQQTARYVQQVSEDITDEERLIIDAVLDYDSLAEDYIPTLSDPVKAKYHGDFDSLKEYFKVWLRMGLRHPTVYLDAFVHQSYGYLAPVNTQAEPPIPYRGDFSEMEHLGISRTSKLIPTVLLDTYWAIIQRVPGVKLLATSGFYFWLVFACAAFLIRKHHYAALLPLLPAIINFFICLASPMHTSIRYALQVAATIPLLLWWTAFNLSCSTVTQCVTNKEGGQ